MATALSGNPAPGARRASARRASRWLAVSLLLASCTRALFTAANWQVNDAVIQHVRFDAARDLWLDIHRPPKGVRNAPVIVFFFGGSWQTGSPHDYRFVGQSLASAGFLVVVPDYRKSPAVVFPAFVEDGARAVAWVQQHAGEYGGDPTRLYLVGHSAGAHIEAMLACDASFLQAVGMQPRDLAGVVGLSGPYDFLPLGDPELMTIFDPPSRWPQSQPVNFVDGDEPPFLLLHGTADDTVAPANSMELAARLRANGEPVELEMIEGAGHLGTLTDLVRDDSRVRLRTLEFIGGNWQSRRLHPAPDTT